MLTAPLSSHSFTEREAEDGCDCKQILSLLLGKDISGDGCLLGRTDGASSDHKIWSEL